MSEATGFASRTGGEKLKPAPHSNRGDELLSSFCDLISQGKFPGDRFMGRKETLVMSGYKSPTTLYEKMRDGEFPQSYSISDGRKAWSFIEVQQWIAEKRKQKAQSNGTHSVAQPTAADQRKRQRVA